MVSVPLSVATAMSEHRTPGAGTTDGHTREHSPDGDPGPTQRLRVKVATIPGWSVTRRR